VDNVTQTRAEKQAPGACQQECWVVTPEILAVTSLVA
jgi:hypothetical protein